MSIETLELSKTTQWHVYSWWLAQWRTQQKIAMRQITRQPIDNSIMRPCVTTKTGLTCTTFSFGQLSHVGAWAFLSLMAEAMTGSQSCIKRKTVPSTCLFTFNSSNYGPYSIFHLVYLYIHIIQYHIRRLKGRSSPRSIFPRHDNQPSWSLSHRRPRMSSTLRLQVQQIDMLVQAFSNHQRTGESHFSALKQRHTCLSDTKVRRCACSREQTTMHTQASMHYSRIPML